MEFSRVTCIVDHLSPFEMVILEALTSAGHRVSVVSIAVPAPNSRALFARRRLRWRLKFEAQRQRRWPTSTPLVIALGLRAGAVATDAGLTTTLLLPPGELEFTSTHYKHKTFMSAMGAAQQVFVTTPWDMDQLCAKGSVVPHRLLPLVALEPAKLRGSSKLVIDAGWECGVRSGRQRPAEPLRQALAAAGEVYVEDPRHAWAIATVLTPDAPAYTRATLATQSLAVHGGLPLAIHGTHQSPATSASPSQKMAPGPWSKLLLSPPPASPVDSEPAPAREFDVYFSVAGIEDRWDSARQLRLRHTAAHWRIKREAILLTSNVALLRRRRAWIQELLAAGYTPRYFYGESSTSPMTPEALMETGAILSLLGRHGCRSAWFQRDLHWLAPEGRPIRESDPTIVERGIHELHTITSHEPLMLAPNEASGRHFNDLLQADGYPDIDWRPCPPALASLSCHPVEPGPRDGLTLLYVGGFGSVYRMDTYLTAISSLPDDVDIDFIVREGDVGELHARLAAANVPLDRVRILHMELSAYQPRTHHTWGVCLLESDYARQAFPYKVISLLERRIPVLHFQDAAIAPLLREYEAGIPVDQSRDAVIDRVVQWRQQQLSPDWGRFETEQSWDARMANLRTILEEKQQR